MLPSQGSDAGLSPVRGTNYGQAVRRSIARDVGSIPTLSINLLLIRLTVGHLTLTQGIVVRIHDEQPFMET